MKMIKMNSLKAFILMMTVLFGLTGCKQFGPALLKSTRQSYNRAVSDGANKELLLNLVRTRYGDPIQFLRLSSIAANFRGTLGGSATATMPQATRRDTFVANVNGSFYEQPTFVYTPLAGQKFATQLLQETDLATYFLLVRAGRSMNVLNRLAVESIGELRNTPGHESFDKFLELTDLWTKMQARDDIEFVRPDLYVKKLYKDVPAEQVDVNTLIYADKSKAYGFIEQPDEKLTLIQRRKTEVAMKLTFLNKGEALLCDQLLGIEGVHYEGPNGTIYEHIELYDPLQQHKHNTHEDIIRVPMRLRSFLKQMKYLAFAIDAPDGDEELVLGFDGSGAGGSTLARTQAALDLLNIRTSKFKPSDDFMSVKHRGNWFYIDDRDQKTKKVFGLLQIMFYLQSNSKGSSPLLTIPVS